MQGRRSYHVLIIDDDREMRQSLEHLLARAGLEVESLSDAHGATRKLAGVRIVKVPTFGFSSVEVRPRRPTSALSGGSGIRSRNPSSRDRRMPAPR